MMEMEILGPIHQEEIKVLTFPFAAELVAQGEGLTLAVAHPCLVGVYSGGSDANAAQMLVGDPLIVGSDIKQRVQARTSGLVYKIRARATDNAGLFHAVDLLLEVDD